MTLVEECRTLASRLLQPHSPYVAEAAAGHLHKAADENARLTAALAAAEERASRLHEAKETFSRNGEAWEARDREVRTILAGTDLASLPNDYPTSRMASDRMAALAAAEERIAALWKERTQILHDTGADLFDALKRTQAAEAALATARNDALEEAAKVAEEKGPSDPRDDWTDYAEIQDGMARRISRAIRAREASVPSADPVEASQRSPCP
jgi:hypothetical protein